MDERLRERVKERYAGVVRSASAGSRALDSEAPDVDWTGGAIPGVRGVSCRRLR